MVISNEEVLRYLGFRKSETGGERHEQKLERARISALITELSGELAEKAAPKNVYGIWDCKVNSPVVALEGMTVKSETLARHLEGCRRVALLAATLGPEADTLIRRYSVQDMEKTVIAQAVCAAMIEAYCDETENEIAKKYGMSFFGSSGLGRTARFSPGYGDFDLAHQKDIANLLNCDRRIGLTLTTAYMLIPSKSVTALIGFTDGEKKPAGEKCDLCTEKKCEYRRT